MVIINLMVEIFILLTIGIFVKKKGILDEHTITHITDLVIIIVIPCSILSSFEIELTSKVLLSSGLILVISIILQGLYGIMNKLLYRSWDGSKQLIAKYGTMVTNASFIGMPIIQSVYGSIGLMYASLFVIPQRILMWSYGLSLFTRSTKNKSFKQVLLHPCVISIFIGIIIMILYTNNIYLPIAISKTIKIIGNCSTPLCFIIIGTFINDIRINQLFDKNIILYCFYRLILLPFIIFLILNLFSIDELTKNVSIVLSSIPAAITTAILAKQYKEDNIFATKLLVSSTLVSTITIPLIIYILEII